MQSLSDAILEQASLTCSDLSYLLVFTMYGFLQTAAEAKPLLTYASVERSLMLSCS